MCSNLLCLYRYEMLERSHDSTCLVPPLSFLFPQYFSALCGQCWVSVLAGLTVMFSCYIINIYPLVVIRFPRIMTFGAHVSWSFLQPPSYDAVEPLDLEEFLMSQLRSGDSALMQELGDFPDDDLKVEQVEKECRTVRHSVPEGGWVSYRKSDCKH